MPPTSWTPRPSGPHPHHTNLFCPILVKGLEYIFFSLFFYFHYFLPFSSSSLSEGTIVDIIASLMVLPNRMCIPLIDQVKVDQMRFPLPRVRKVSLLFILFIFTRGHLRLDRVGDKNLYQLVVGFFLSLSTLQGVVRVHLVEARDLVAKDTYMMGLVKGKSDPYATIRVGNRSLKSKTIKENLHPKWNEVYEVELSTSCYSCHLHLVSLLPLTDLDLLPPEHKKNKNLLTSLSLSSTKPPARRWSWRFLTRTRIKTTLLEGKGGSESLASHTLLTGVY